MKPGKTPKNKIRCSQPKMVPIAEPVPNPRNPNKHTPEQIALLAKVIDHQGWRAPIVISKQSGFIVVGHGRLEAAKLLELEQVPVDYQDFESPADEWAHLIADNRIAELADMDNALLKDLLKELQAAGTEMDLTGFDSMEFKRLMEAWDVKGTNDPASIWAGMPDCDNKDLLENSLIIRFKTKEAKLAFAKVIKQKVELKTKAIWHPKWKADINGTAEGVAYVHNKP